MKIRETDGELVDIFAVYWFDSSTYFAGLPKGNGGLIAYKESDVVIVDATIDFKSVFFKNNGKGIYHWALIEEKLLDDIYESDENAYHRFLEIIKSEGLVDKDFY